jgi:hypothetical protein
MATAEPNCFELPLGGVSVEVLAHPVIFEAVPDPVKMPALPALAGYVGSPTTAVVPALERATELPKPPVLTTEVNATEVA